MAETSAPLTNATPACMTYQGAGALVPNMKTYFTTVTTSGGVATCYPTTTGTAAGTALFSSIMFAGATAWSNTTNPILAADAAGKTISADLRTISFNVTIGTGVLVGGVSLAFAPDNTPVHCVVFGT